MWNLRALEDLEITEGKTEKSWRQENNYCTVINRFHITALSNPHWNTDSLMYIFVFSRVFLPFSLHLNLFPEVSVIVLSGVSYFHSLMLVKKLAVLIVVCLLAISCTLHCGQCFGWWQRFIQLSGRNQTLPAEWDPYCLLIMFVFMIMHHRLHGTWCGFGTFSAILD